MKSGLDCFIFFELFISWADGRKVLREILDAGRPVPASTRNTPFSKPGLRFSKLCKTFRALQVLFQSVFCRLLVGLWALKLAQCISQFCSVISF